MEKLLRNVKKELQHIAEEGLNNANLETAYKLVDIAKDIGEIEEQEQKMQMKDYGMYRDKYNRYDEYPERDRYRDRYSGRDYSDYGRHMPGGRVFRGDDRLNRMIERFLESSEMYDYGRDRYRGGGNEEQMHEGLENMMYAICTLVEELLECAETPKEKDIIHKHLKKLSAL